MKIKVTDMAMIQFDKDFNGLLFLMGGKKQCFWMKNCLIPLDIIIIKNNVIVNIHHNCPIPFFGRTSQIGYMPVPKAILLHLPGLK